MRASYRFSLLLVAACLPMACSSKSDKKPTPQQAQPQNNNDNDAGDSDAAVNNNATCEVWPAEKLAPIVGPFFYGAGARLCRVNNNAQKTSAFLEYDGDHVLSMTIPASGDRTTYQYSDAMIVSSVRTQGSTTTTSTYEYGSNLFAITYVTGSETSKQTYALDAQGYPTSITISPPLANQPVRFTFEYQDCRLSKLTAYNADNTVNDSLTAEYYYDDQGRLTERAAAKDDPIYVYFDADGNCPKSQ